MSNGKFNYTYSALTEEEKMEVQAIQREYSPDKQKQNALSSVRSLDKKVKRPAEIVAFTLGVIGILLLGVGMCMALESISGGTVLGSIIGVVGIAIMAVNYKIYKLILNARKKKYGAEILEITEKLLNPEEDK